jgi:MoxR-like ATPase
VAKARALAEGRDFAMPDDVKAVAAPVLAHRLILAPEARSAALDAEDLVADALERTPVPV